MNRALLLVFFFLTLGVSLSLAQSDPALKRATTFTVLASTEIINNADQTGVTGNVGVHPGTSIVGEERMSILQGRTEKGTAIAANAQEDALAAYNFFLAQKDDPKAKELSPIIGTGTTLTPGVHKISGDLSLQGRLTLEGLGDDNSVFIIIVDGNLLSESPNASIIGQNGGHEKNLFWIISGEVRLGSISAMKGNMLAKRDIILNGVTVEGRAISLEGKVVFNGEKNNLYLPSTIDPNLSVVKTAPARNYRVGDHITYTILVHNEGPGTATVVNMKERFPESLRYIPGSAVHSVGVFDESNYIWSLDFLQFGESQEIKLTFEILSAGQIVNTVIVKSEETKEEDPPVKDEVIIEVPEISSNLNVTKVAAGAPYYVGGNVTYTITVNNAGPYDAKAVTLTEVLPEGLEFVSAAVSQGAYDNTTGLYTIGDLAVGSQATLTLIAKINAPGNIVNTVTVSPGGNVPDLTPGDNTGGEEIEVTCEPITAVEVTGASLVCEGTNDVKFTATRIPGATYNFTLTDGLSKVSQTDNNITVNVTTSGVVQVEITDKCGNTYTALKAITTTTLPNAPTAITGSATVCVGNQVTYSTAAINRADSYVWDVPTGWTIVSGEGTRTITLQVGNTPGSVDLSVAAANACGNTSTATIAVQVNEIPAAPAAITGEAIVCAGTDATYSVAAVAGATGYTWTMPNGWRIVSGEGTASVAFKVGEAGGNITVTADNGCGSSPVTTLAVTVNDKPETPGAITGPSAVCAEGTGNVYSIAAVDGATGYVWTVPDGWTIENGQNTTSITVTAGETAGAIKVKATNECGDSGERTYNSTINPVPAAPVAITGEATVCAGTEATYAVAAVTGATGYTWTLPTGWSIVSGEGTAQVTVQVGSAAGAISVTADNNCGGSSAATLAITVNDKLAAPAITGEAGACIGESLTYTIPAVTGATGYAWAVPATWTLVSGQNTTSIVVEVGEEAGQVTVGVINDCGTGNAATLNVAPVLAPTETNEIVGNSAVCEYGETVTYTLATVEEGVTYTWAVPADWTLVDGQGTGTITVNTTAAAGTISVIATNTCGTAQSISKDVSITVPPVSPGAIIDNSNVCDGLTYTIDAVTGATGYTWTVPAGFTITSGQGTTTITVTADSPTAAGQVTVSALNGTCSSIAASATIDVSLADGQLNFPKAFSPNGDGKNDTWMITNLEKFTANEVTIFNRWGSEVYKTSNYQNNWSASKLGPGTYFFKVRVTLCEGVVKEFTGYTTLFR
ncbi:DUF3494 domain-containing protein [Pontibacter diazotrophicus]|uniref:DUF3494 domain-containing protein n=1 Tax=Pontibacter diazotrophicus TaxID=1400979 RepID=A0A3D8L2F3_9BACT|nr:ice-binding family protein [Pontibacter diazotrophicus]RDV11536.1 DUF3494 domain-containing protein [Pontibacter diazotrophicus]